jgi:hypothetical protein
VDALAPSSESSSLPDGLENGDSRIDPAAILAGPPGQVNTLCVTNTVDAYLTDLIAPPNESVYQHGNQQLQPPN